MCRVQRLADFGFQFNTREIEQALKEDYPSLDIVGTSGDALAFDCNTDAFITAPMFMSSKGADSRPVSLIRLPGYGTWDPASISHRQTLHCPDISQRLLRNRSYICVSVGARDHSLQETFRAARLCSCVAAVFAKLPIALAAYWETGDHFLSPEAVVTMADEAIADRWPVTQWVGLELFTSNEGFRQSSGGLTNGLKAFRGFEISHPDAPVPISKSAESLITTSVMCLEYARDYNDGDTIGVEGQPREEAYRIRFAPVGTGGSTCDTYLIVHPLSTFDHEALCGPITSQPPPPGTTNDYPVEQGFFKRMMRGTRPN
jgi:hypothetical protein